MCGMPRLVRDAFTYVLLGMLGCTPYTLLYTLGFFLAYIKCVKTLLLYCIVQKKNNEIFYITHPTCILYIY